MTSDAAPQQIDKVDKTKMSLSGVSGSGISGASGESDKNNGPETDPSVGRVLFRGRLKAPRRDLLAATTAAFPILKNELTVQRPDDAPVIEVDSTALPQPFLNPDRPLGH